MRRLVIALATLAAFSGAALADFLPFDQAKFEALVKSNAPVVVHTHESWCPVCRVQSDILERLQKDPKLSKVTMFRAHPANDRKALEPLKVTSRSIILVFAGGKEVGRLNWITDEASIRLVIEMAAEE